MHFAENRRPGCRYVNLNFIHSVVNEYPINARFTAIHRETNHAAPACQATCSWARACCSARSRRAINVGVFDARSQECHQL